MSRAVTERASSMAEKRVTHAKPINASGGRALDRVFMHDLVLDVEIGVYTHEKGVTQRVRFSVDVDILPATANLNDDIHRALDYDHIIGGIKSIIAGGHINLVETLAGEVADLCLEHPRASRVTVRVEKLDKEPGSVGVEIVRIKKGARR